MLVAIIIGLLFGFIGSMPLAGPIAVLVLAAALNGRPREGLFIGLGCAVAESGYATLAFWGFSRFLTDYPWIEPVSSGLAAVILIVLGVVLWRRSGVLEGAGEEAPRSGRSVLLGFSITALNPTLIGTWAAAVTILFSSGLVAFEPISSVPFGLGVLVGISGWYAVLVGLVARFTQRFRQQTLDRFVQVMGVLLVVIGLWFAWSFGEYLVGRA